MIEANRPPVCLVTGGSSGIGLATCRLFLENGYAIAYCGRDGSRLESSHDQLASIAGEDKVLAVQADVGDPDQVDDFVSQTREQLHRIDIVVNNAGVVPFGMITELTHADLQHSMDINIGGTFSTTKAAWPIMKEQGGGIFANISSLAVVDPFVGNGTYGASKAWIEAFTNTIAQEGADDNIRAFTIRPGAVETPMLRRLFPDFPADQAVSPDAVARQIHELTGPEYLNRSGEILTVSK